MLRPGTLALTALLASLTAIGPLSVDMYLPSLPEIARLLAAPASRVQLTLSSYLVGFAFGQILYGPLSDHYGRKPVLLAALGLFVLASLACAASTSVEMLIVARFAQAFGGSGSVVLSRAIVRDLYSGAQAARQLSLMGAMMALAPMIAPLLGGVLQTFVGWRAVFLTLAALAASLTLVTWRVLPETLPKRAGGPLGILSVLRSYRTFAREGVFVAHLGIVAVSYAGLFAWLSGGSFVLQDLYGLSAISFALAFTVGSAGYMTGTVLAAALVTRLGIDRTIGIGTVALLVGGLGMMAVLALGFASAAALVIPMAVYLAGLGLAMPQAMAGALQPFPDRAGTASSLMGVVQQGLASMVGALVGTLLVSAWPVAFAVAACGATCLAIWLGTRRIRTGT